MQIVQAAQEAQAAQAASSSAIIISNDQDGAPYQPDEVEAETEAQQKAAAQEVDDGGGQGGGTDHHEPEPINFNCNSDHVHVAGPSSQHDHTAPPPSTHIQVCCEYTIDAYASVGGTVDESFITAKVIKSTDMQILVEAFGIQLESNSAKGS